MLFENNGILQKWHMRNTPPEIDKHDTYKKWYVRKIAHLAKKYPAVICQGLSWGILKRKFLNLSHDSDTWSWDFKVEFFPLESDIPITLLCLIVGEGSITMVLEVLQKSNNVVLMSFLSFTLGAIFARWYLWYEECPFCGTMSMGAINVRWL